MIITIQEQILEVFNLEETKLDKRNWIQEIAGIVKTMERELNDGVKENG